MTRPSAYYITTPIYYVNDLPHIGHAYTTLACDVLARFMRADGHDVMFLTGTDEHGQKVEKSASAAGVEPMAFVDSVSERFRDLAGVMGFTNDDFIRTTEPRHISSCQEIWRRIAANNAPDSTESNIYLGKYDGWYSVRDEAFYAESELTKGADGVKVAPSGAPVEWVEEPSYFFRLSAWQEPLLKFYEDNPDFIAPDSRRNEVISFVRSGLLDLSISRTSFSWGVPVPDDPKHIMYVWLDALTNYITAAGFPDESKPSWETYWPADLHMVGKDIVRFHAVYWPAFLMAAGLAPPKRVYAHGWWTNEGQKISKSLGNVIDPLEMVEQYGLDAVRYFLLREVPFGNDGDFSRRSMVGRINSDLANDLGNLAQRTLSMIAKNCDGQLPSFDAATAPDADFASRESLLAARGLISGLRDIMGRQSFHEALELVWTVVRDANRTIDADAPWKLRKTDPEAMKAVLWLQAETIRHIAIVLRPFMPTAMDAMLDQLGVGTEAREFSCLSSVGELTDEHSLVPGTALPKPSPVFPRYVDEEEEEGA
ncbi:MAG: methionine--tRNA ligase [Alphaproteobacteria bacterium]|jgi:methionyl-tRNA synthetase|nr:methionine--tRNA ligase [Alphaproteobacteria bacterium]